MQADYLFLLTLGIVLVLTPLTRSAFERIRLPPFVGYLFLGLIVSLLDRWWAFATPGFEHGFSVLAELGVVALLFRVGLKSHPGALLRKLPEASVIWGGEVSTNLLLAFVASYYVLSLSLTTSIIVATALSATSVAVSVSCWEDLHALDSPNGQLLVDVAELDDLSAVLLLAVLLAVLPALAHGRLDVALLPAIGVALVVVVVKLVVFVAGCYLFAQYVEPGLTRFNTRWDTPTGVAIAVLGAGLAIAAAAGSLGFSLAIGALFAGLAFSRDPDAVRVDAKFENFYELLTPFFFVFIGMNVEPGVMLSSLGLGAALLAVAAAGKLAGVAGPALWVTNRKDALLLGISMIPRAEITLVIVYQCQSVFPSAIPEAVFAGLVLVSIFSTIITPLALRAAFEMRE